MREQSDCIQISAMIMEEIRMNPSSFKGYYKLSIEERLAILKKETGLSDEEINILKNTGGLTSDQADRMIENVVGVMPVTLGIATNFVINGVNKIVPMAIEEPSVVAAASNAARLSNPAGGFRTRTTDPIMIGQIQLTGIDDPEAAKTTIEDNKARLLEIGNGKDPMLVKLGGGARDIEVRIIDTIKGKMVVSHLLVNCLDAMGANAVNTMAEAIAPEIEKLTGGKVYLRILSNLAIYRLAFAEATWTKEALGGEDVVDGVIEAYAFAEADPFRCATHNKGIMNGIDAVILATGNDFRAIEAGAHAYAAWKHGGYKPLTSYEKNENGDLVGKIEIPMAVGLIGGATAVHPTAKIAVKILDIKGAGELAQIVAAVGLAQNFAAMRALATEGIQRGHMGLHARNIAVMAGAEGEMIDRVVSILVKEKNVRIDRAKEVLEELG